MTSRSHSDSDKILLDHGIHMYLPHFTLHGHHFFSQHNRTHVLQHILATLTRKQFYLLLRLRISQCNPHHEAIQLCFRQTIGAFKLQRVLCCKQQKRLRQYVSCAVYGHTAFLHGFQ
ncbi:hypothetical protein D3C74_369670 [compost metagenome]